MTALVVAEVEMTAPLVIAGCGYGAEPDKRAQFAAEAEASAKRFEELTMAKAAEAYALGPTRVQHQNRDPRGWREFADQFAEHSTEGAALTMRGVQAKRPSLFELVDKMKAITAPTLIMTGDEDWPCLEPGLLMKKNIATAALVVMPNAPATTSTWRTRPRSMRISASCSPPPMPAPGRRAIRAPWRGRYWGGDPPEGRTISRASGMDRASQERYHARDADTPHASPAPAPGCRWPQPLRHAPLRRSRARRPPLDESDRGRRAGCRATSERMIFVSQALMGTPCPANTLDRRAKAPGGVRRPRRCVRLRDVLRGGAGRGVGARPRRLRSSLAPYPLRAGQGQMGGAQSLLRRLDPPGGGERHLPADRDRACGATREDRQLAGIFGKRRVALNAISAATLMASKSKLANGDVIGFISRRPGLDFFHTGLIVLSKDGSLMLRSASRQPRQGGGRSDGPVRRRQPGRARRAGAAGGQHGDGGSRLFGPGSRSIMSAARRDRPPTRR